MQTNSRYLTLALDIRRLSDSLIRLAEEGVEAPQMGKAINQFLSSLQDNGHQTSVRALRDRGVFGQYENVVTVNEVIKPPQRLELIDRLVAVLGPGDQAQRKENALQAVAFFDSLERRALYRYSHPKVESRVSA